MSENPCAGCSHDGQWHNSRGKCHVVKYTDDAPVPCVCRQFIPSAQPVAPAPDMASVLAGLVEEMREVEASYRVLSSDGHEGMDGLAEAWAGAADMVECQATSGARAAGGESEEYTAAPGGCGDAMPRPVDATWPAEWCALPHGHAGWHRSHNNNIEWDGGIVRAAAPPTPSASGVAALLAECARRQEYLGSYREPTFSCREIQRYLAPEGADGSGEGT